MAVPHTHKRKANAETQQCGNYDSAFLADRGCFFTIMHMKKKPRSVRLEQTHTSLNSDHTITVLPHPRLEA
jgi:hypothetical protein